MKTSFISFCMELISFCFSSFPFLNLAVSIACNFLYDVEV